MYANEAPGLGIDIDEKLAAKYPVTESPSFTDFQLGHDSKTRRHSHPAMTRSLSADAYRSPSRYPNASPGRQDPP